MGKRTRSGKKRRAGRRRTRRPGGAGAAREASLGSSTESIDPRVLARVRALLAKAESTTFPAEAEALSAKAQELMTRYSLDRAVVASERGGETAPVQRRIPLEAPYADAKALLLAEVASASSCQTAWSREASICTVVGFEADIEATELLFTSLLVQAGTAMRASGPVRDSAGRSRTRSFRRSFLLGFATRIGERLREATMAATEQAEADHGMSMLPVLAGRSARVDDAFGAAFPDPVSRSISASSRVGYFAGKLAADQASVAMRPGVEQAAST